MLLEKSLFVREKIIEENIDYFICTTIDVIATFVLSSRSAPKQIFWSDTKEASQINSIDMHVSHILRKGVWKCFTIDEQKKFIIGNKELQKQAKNIKETFLTEMGKESILLGTLESKSNLQNESFMNAIANIMQKNPQVIYFILGNHHKNTIQKQIEKFNIDKQRFTFIENLDRHLFGWIIDIYLDTISNKEEHIIDEMINKMKPVILYNNANSKEFFQSITQLLEDKESYQKFVKQQYEMWDTKRKKYSDLITLIEKQEVSI